MDRLLISEVIVQTKRTGIYRRAVPVACALLALCAGTWIAMGQAIFTEYTGAATPRAVVDPGKVECPGGQPTGIPWFAGPPCSPGSRVHFRGVVLEFDQEATDPRATGRLSVVVNGNFDRWPGASGPFWGSFRQEVAQGGVWEGTWTGERTPTAETLRAVGHGSGGSVDGLKNEEQLSRSTALAIFPRYSVTGRILQPGGN